MDRLADLDVERHGDLHGQVTTAYVNTIARERQPAYPGDLGVERRLNALIRWNAMVMVLRAGKHSNV
jgi:pyruvate dehydrogenase E1 component